MNTKLAPTPLPKFPMFSPLGEPLWFIFRVREQMYGMVFGRRMGFSMLKIPDHEEPTYDSWCRTEAAFTYIKLHPLPTDAVLDGLHMRVRDVVQTDAPERAFLERHAPTVLETVKRTCL